MIVKHSFDLRRKGGISTSVKWHPGELYWAWYNMNQGQIFQRQCVSVKVEVVDSIWLSSGSSQASPKDHRILLALVMGLDAVSGWDTKSDLGGFGQVY